MLYEVITVVGEVADQFVRPLRDATQNVRVGSFEYEADIRLGRSEVPHGFTPPESRLCRRRLPGPAVSFRRLARFPEFP